MFLNHKKDLSDRDFLPWPDSARTILRFAGIFPAASNRPFFPFDGQIFVAHADYFTNGFTASATTFMDSSISFTASLVSGASAMMRMMGSVLLART
jgi:hypothetical protein